MENNINETELHIESAESNMSGFKGSNKEQHRRASVLGGRSAHNPTRPKSQRCHEFTTTTASAAANKRWGNR